MSTLEHWQTVYSRREADRVSWYQPNPGPSLALIAQAKLPKDAPIIDVGGGASTLVDHLVAAGRTRVTVVDIAPAALEVAQRRLLDAAARAEWRAQDVLQGALGGPYALWHDRAVFHFLVEPEDQARYVQRAAEHVIEGGYAILGTFADDGPERCSGLPVQRYSPEALAARLAPHFAPVHLVRHAHRTPGGAEQRFAFALLRRRSG